MWREEETVYAEKQGRKNARPEWFVKEKSYWYERVIQKFNFSHLSPDNQLGRGKTKPQTAQYKFRMVNDNCSDQEIVRQIIENVTQQREPFAKIRRGEALPERNTHRARIYRILLEETKITFPQRQTHIGSSSSYMPASAAHSRK
jgi:hypothetical protein